jgi:hypothetical protein
MRFLRIMNSQLKHATSIVGLKLFEHVHWYIRHIHDKFLIRKMSIRITCQKEFQIVWQNRKQLLNPFFLFSLRTFWQVHTILKPRVQFSYNILEVTSSCRDEIARGAEVETVRGWTPPRNDIGCIFHTSHGIVKSFSRISFCYCYCIIQISSMLVRINYINFSING